MANDSGPEKEARRWLRRQVSYLAYGLVARKDIRGSIERALIRAMAYGRVLEQERQEQERRSNRDLRGQF